MTYRRPTFKTMLLTVAAALVASATITLARPVELRLDGQLIGSDVSPITSGSGQVYVPLRSVADALGARVVVRGSRIAIVRGHQSLRLRVGDVHAEQNGMPFTFERAPFRVRGRVMVGIASLARALDVHVSYDARTARVDILTPGIGEAGNAAAPATF